MQLIFCIVESPVKGIEETPARRNKKGTPKPRPILRPLRQGRQNSTQPGAPLDGERTKPSCCFCRSGALRLRSQFLRKQKLNANASLNCQFCSLFSYGMSDSHANQSSAANRFRQGGVIRLDSMNFLLRECLFLRAVVHRLPSRYTLPQHNISTLIVMPISQSTSH